MFGKNSKAQLIDKSYWGRLNTPIYLDMDLLVSGAIILQVERQE